MDATCDLCAIEGREPAPAEWDAPIGGGAWGYLCRGHEGMMACHVAMATPLTDDAKARKRLAVANRKR